MGLFFLGIGCSFLDVSGGEFSKVDEWFANGGVWVVEIVVEFGKLFGVEADGADADLEETGGDGFDAVVDFGGGFVVSGAVDTGDGLDFVFLEDGDEVFGFVELFFVFGGGVVRDDNEEGFVHDVCFLREDVDEVDVIVHKDAEEHVVVVAADVHEAGDVGADVDALGADEDLGGKVEGVEEVLVRVFDAFTFGFGHKVEVDGLASDDGAEGAVFHDDHAVAKLGDEEGGLGGLRVVRGGLSGSLGGGSGDGLVVDDGGAGDGGGVR